jgi:hypothetical protein
MSARLYLEPAEVAAAAKRYMPPPAAPPQPPPPLPVTALWVDLPTPAPESSDNHANLARLHSPTVAQLEAMLDGATAPAAPALAPAAAQATWMTFEDAERAAAAAAATPEVGPD